MILSPTHNKIDNLLKVALFPSLGSSLSTQSLQMRVQLPFKMNLTPDALKNEYLANLYLVSLYLQEHPAKAEDIIVLMKTDMSHFKQAAKNLNIPNDILVVLLIVQALKDKVAGAKCSVEELCESFIREHPAIIDLSDEGFRESFSANLNDTATLEKLNQLGVEAIVMRQEKKKPATVTFMHKASVLIQQKRKELCDAISDGQVDTALALADELPIEALVEQDVHGADMLFYAVSYGQLKVATKMMEKMIEADKRLDTPDVRGFTVLNYKPEFIYHFLMEQYQNYACSDYKRFTKQVREGKLAWVKEKFVLTTDLQASHEANANLNAQPIDGQYTRAQIGNVAMNVDKAKSACCTTFALSIANRLLQFLPSQPFKILSHPNGVGSHCFVALTAADPDRDEIILDPWLASLGWGAAVYEKHAYPWPGYLENTEEVFCAERSEALATSKFKSAQ